MVTGTVASAAVLVGRRALQVQQIEPAMVPTDGGWLAVEACGMCGSDWAWYAEREVPGPMVLGHEIAGIVEEVPAALAETGVSLGERVVLEEAISCLRCRLCRAGRHRLCPAGRRYGGTPRTRPPQLWGGFAERVFLDPHAIVHVVPPGVSGHEATLFVPLSNGLSWLSSAAGLQPGESVVVLGPGQHGLACVAAARRLGAGRVVAVGRPADGGRLETARALGADEVVEADAASLTSVLRDRLGGEAADVVVDTTPGWTGALSTAVEVAALGGRIVVAGNKGGETSPLPTDRLFRREITLRGVAARESWAIDAALDWLAEHDGVAEAFADRPIALDGVETALQALGGEAGGPRPLHPVVVP